MKMENCLVANDNIRRVTQMKMLIVVGVMSGLCTSLVMVSLYHHWVKHQPISRERIKIATCDRNLLIHQEAVRLAKLNLPDNERKKEIIKYIVKYRKITEAHPELIFDPQPQGTKILDLTVQIKKEIESIDWK